MRLSIGKTFECGMRERQRERWKGRIMSKVSSHSSKMSYTPEPRQTLFLVPSLRGTVRVSIYGDRVFLNHTFCSGTAVMIRSLVEQGSDSGIVSIKSSTLAVPTLLRYTLDTHSDTTPT